jgi:hypothetical protein
MIIRITLISLFFLFSACATTGRNFDESVFMNQIKKCQTTKAELRELLGKPRQEGIQAGYKTLQYNYALAIVGSFTTKSAIVFLNSSDVVVDFALNPVGLVEVRDECSSDKMSTEPIGT